MAEKLPIAFLAGLLSGVTPCVLPLVPGYLAAVSSLEVGALGKPGSSRRILLGSVPFIAFDPADAAASVMTTRVAEPTAAAVAPALPGSAVCSLR